MRNPVVGPTLESWRPSLICCSKELPGRAVHLAVNSIIIMVVARHYVKLHGKTMGMKASRFALT